MKRVLIISPYSPPTNAADMQRVRMSLPYYKSYNWDAEVVTVDERYSDLPKDDLLCESLPVNITIHRVKALNKAWTSKLGLGSLALRSLWHYNKTVSKLLKRSQFDLIYFSTTQFPVCVLGAYWKKKFGIPYVIDMQDPWHSEYYLDKPKHQRPPKYWFAYRLNKYLEPLAMRYVDGLISVSKIYIDNLKLRYPKIADIPASTVTFGYLEQDIEIAEANKNKFKPLLDSAFKNIVYIGRGGGDMHQAIKPLFSIFKDQLPAFQNIRLYFIGTSYAPAGMGRPTILPLAKQFGLEHQVVEITERISYYHTLATLQQADALFVPGSDDPGYTASKIYPYILVNKPLLAIFNPNSPAINTLKKFGIKRVYGYDNIPGTDLYKFLSAVSHSNAEPAKIDYDAFRLHSAQRMTALQCELFNRVVKG